jgi:hypothetical protein
MAATDVINIDKANSGYQLVVLIYRSALPAGGRRLK